jgi:hypothetical protein
MLEKDLENLIARYPEEFFPNSEFTLVGPQVKLGRCYADIMFKDKYGRTIIIEIKRGILSRDASGQIMEYYGLLKQQDPNQVIELILCANVIPHERRTFLESTGIECKELGIAPIINVANKYSYRFLDASQAEDKARETTQTITRPLLPKFSQSVGEGRSVWIFQANPSRYDLLNSFSDDSIGNEIHWQVNQYKGKIRKGNIGLIWMSGKEAGIYAITEITSDPEYIIEPPNEDKYWLDSGNRGKEKLRVKMLIKTKLINNPIFRYQLRETKGLENLSILKFTQGTNFPVTATEWKIISDLVYRASKP